MILLFTFLVVPNNALGQAKNDFSLKLDSLLASQRIHPFNGQILISKNDTILYSKTKGYSDLEAKKLLVKNNQFIIGSLSKQITAVLVLQALDRGELYLKDTLAHFLPDIKTDWSNSITIHHLLNHTHGIEDLEKPLKFVAGTAFSYSNLGYELLGQILEKVTGKKYAQLTSELFEVIGLTNTSDPTISNKKNLAIGTIRSQNGSLKHQETIFEKVYIPGGYLLSNAEDLVKWNAHLHSGRLLSKESYKLLTTPSSVQNHSLFGEIGYAYGLRISTEDKILEIGHTGYVPGFISMAFYYPKSKTTIIVLENIDWNDDDIKKTFYFELESREIIRKYSLKK